VIFIQIPFSGYCRLLSAYRDRLCNPATDQHRRHTPRIFSSQLRRYHRLGETPTFQAKDIEQIFEGKATCRLHIK
jgi:hypothetical protein